MMQPRGIKLPENTRSTPTTPPAPQGMPIDTDASVAQINGLGQRSTQASQKFRKGPMAKYGQPILQTGVSEDRDAPGTDQWSVFPEEYKTLGIPEDYEHFWVRAPEHWSRIEQSDRVQDAMRQCPGSFALLNEDETEFSRTVGDLVLMCRPKKDPELVAQESARACSTYLHSLKGDGDVHPSVPRFDRSRIEKSDMAERQHDEYVRMGVVGATSALNYTEQIATQQGRAKIEALQEKARNGGMHYSASQKQRVYAREQEKMAESSASVARAKAGTTFPHGSIPANIGRTRPAGFQEAAAASRGRK